MPPSRPRSQSFFRGVALRCPRCGGGRLFRGFFRMHDAGLSRAQLTELSQDDASAGCMMGIALALIVLFGLLMAGVTIYFTMMTPTASLPSV